MDNDGSRRLSVREFQVIRPATEKARRPYKNIHKNERVLVDIGNLVLAPSIWNDLPPTLYTSSTTVGQFQNKQKTVLFCSAYGI